MNILEKAWAAAITLIQWVATAILVVVFNYIFYSPYF